MTKELVQSFLPWILYFILVGSAPWQINLAVSVAVITAIIFEIKGLKEGFVLSWGTLIFFIFLFISVVILKHPTVIKYQGLFSNGSLALIAWISILIRLPFTIQYAKKMVAPQYWQTPTFKKINYIITAVWALSFTLGVFLNLLHVKFAEFSGWSYEIISYAPSIFAIWFTSVFPEWYKARYLK
jgi:hypothetical protein